MFSTRLKIPSILTPPWPEKGFTTTTLRLLSISLRIEKRFDIDMAHVR